MSTTPSYAVIFFSKQSKDNADYASVAEIVEKRARSMPGFLRMESVHDAEGNGITVCYWDSLEAIQGWKKDEEHRWAQQQGQERWYEEYRLSVAKVEYEYSSKK